MIIQIPNSFIPERQYIIDVLFREFLGLEYNLEVVDGLTNYRILAGLKSITICDAFFSRVKGDQYLDECYLPCAAVFASGPLIPGEDLPVIYGDTLLAIGDDHITCGIDIFASSFFMLTRWEEYVIDERAVDNLFPENRTYAVKNNLQMRPIVNEYVEFLWNMLVAIGFQHQRRQHNYELFLTHDVDRLLRYSSWKKYAKALVGDILLRKNPLLMVNTTADFLRIQLGVKKDPYDTFDWLMDVAETNGVKSHFYFIPGHSGEKGTDYDIRDSEVVRRAQHIARRGHVVGMHAGYDSYNNASIFAREYSRLAAIVPSPIEGRQHYLRFENPTTWEIWNQRGMKVDSTVGYNFHVGFRSGVCYPYPVFNIIERRKLELRERPLVVMDNPARRISNNGVEFENLVIELAQIVYQYGGAFVLLWHNNNFHDHGWDEYAKHYETIVNRLTGLKDNNK